MTMTLGRVGTDIAFGDPTKWTRNGSQVTLTGVSGIGVSTSADRVTLSEQLLGLADNPDEHSIACTWTLEAWFDGFYKVLAVSVDTNPKYDGYFPYSITLDRVADANSPRIDSVILGALRTNGNSVTSAVPAVWAPSAATHAYVNSLGLEGGNPAITGAIRATSNDAAGNRYVLACSAAQATDLTQGAVSPSAYSAAHDLMIGYELNGSSALTNDLAQTLAYQWYYPMNITMRPRAR